MNLRWTTTVSATNVYEFNTPGNRATIAGNGPLKAHSHCTFFSDCYWDSSYHNKWVAQNSMKVFTICDFDNITNSYVVHHKQKQIAVAVRKKSHSVYYPLIRKPRPVANYALPSVR